MPMFAKCDAVPHEICGTCLFSGIHSRHSFWEFQSSTPCRKKVPECGRNSNHPLPCRKKVPECGSTLQHLCIVLASCHPFVAAAGKNLSHAEKQRVWSRSYGLQDLLQCSDCALSCAMRLLQPTNTCRD